jgi:hypothetical protein
VTTPTDFPALASTNCPHPLEIGSKRLPGRRAIPAGVCLADVIYENDKRPAAVVLAETSYNSGEGSRAGADPGWKVDLLQILRNAGRT